MGKELGTVLGAFLYCKLRAPDVGRYVDETGRPLSQENSFRGVVRNQSRRIQETGKLPKIGSSPGCGSRWRPASVLPQWFKNASLQSLGALTLDLPILVERV